MCYNRSNEGRITLDFERQLEMLTILSKHRQSLCPGGARGAVKNFADTLEEDPVFRVQTCPCNQTDFIGCTRCDHLVTATGGNENGEWCIHAEEAFADNKF